MDKSVKISFYYQPIELRSPLNDPTISRIIILDENIGQRGINQLKQAGYDVSTVLEQGLASASDPTVIKVCQAEVRCLVTLDLDFSNPLQYVPSQYKGIAVLRLPNRATIDDLTDAIQTLIGGLQRENITGNLWIIQRGRIRIYQQNDR